MPVFAAEENVDAQVLAAARAADAFYQRRIATLTDGLNSPNEATRIEALRTIGFLQDPDLTDKLLPWMQSSNRSSAEIIAAITALTDSGTLIAAPALRQLLKHDNAQVRANAMNGLTRAQQVEKADYAKAASDSESSLRASGNVNLGLIKAEDAAPILLHSLALDINPHVRRMCAIALGQLGNREHGAALAQALCDSNPGVRRYAAEALVKLNYTPAIPNLLMAMEGNIAGDHIARSLTLMTKQDFGFNSRANPLARTEAVEKGFIWWNAHAKELDR
jgi:HEAT repeat protein